MDNKAGNIFPKINEIKTAIDKLISSDKKTILVAIDGKSTGGKTTLGKYLSKIYDSNLYHMDDFFLQGFQRTKERMSEIGGNVDYERFLKEVITPILEFKEVSYTPFDCSTFTLRYDKTLHLPHKRLNIIEGSYSQHPYFNNPYSLKIFMDIEDNKQLERLSLRENDDKLAKFIELWIPKENAYFKKYHIQEKSDIVI
jgi:hypothetical protein